jgi:hypothetical protein
MPSCHFKQNQETYSDTFRFKIFSVHFILELKSGSITLRNTWLKPSPNSQKNLYLTLSTILEVKVFHGKLEICKYLRKWSRCTKQKFFGLTADVLQVFLTMLWFLFISFQNQKLVIKFPLKSKFWISGSCLAVENFLETIVRRSLRVFKFSLSKVNIGINLKSEAFLFRIPMKYVIYMV